MTKSGQVVKGYNGNQNLVGRGSKFEYTPEMLLEIAKCKRNPVYFAEKYFKIISVDDGLIPLKLYLFQKNAIRLARDNRKLLLATSRQIGKTTIATVIILHYAMFNKNRRIFLLANKGDTAREILDRIQLAYEHLPHFLKSEVVEWNKGSVEFGNGTYIMAAASSSDAIRGRSASLLYLDECVGKDTKITVRNKKTGEISQMSMEELWFKYSHGNIRPAHKNISGKPKTVFIKV